MTQRDAPETPTAEAAKLGEVASLFAKMGATAFGGPAAHIAIMQDEVVDRRRWISRQHFLDLIAATNLIPGPNSTEMAMHIGHERAGRLGMVVAGAAFILPAVAITALLAWAYVTFGTRPAVGAILFGIKPAVIVVVAAAAWKLAKKAIKGGETAVIGLATAAMVFAGLQTIYALLIGGVVGMLWLRQARGAGSGAKSSGCAILPLAAAKPIGAAGAGINAVATGGATGIGMTAIAGGVSLMTLGLVFLKVGAILYGSGYVLFSFLEDEIVRSRGWMTQDTLLDAVAVGQFTPGPVLSTATFVGYVIAGPLGALVATVGIFLPSFVFVSLLNPVVPRLRKSVWTAAFLDAVGAAAVALIAVVVVRFGVGLGGDWKAWLIVTLAGAAVFWRKMKAMHVVAGCGVVGVLGWLIGAW